MMPIAYTSRNIGDKPTPHYWHNTWLTPDVDACRRFRAEYSRRREEMLAFQKQARNRDDARFFKEEASDALKWFRAADAWVKLLSAEKGWRPTSDWPVELQPYFDRVQAAAS